MEVHILRFPVYSCYMFTISSLKRNFYHDRRTTAFQEAAAVAAATAAAASAALDALANIDFSEVDLSDPAALQETQNQVSGRNLLYYH